MIAGSDVTEGPPCAAYEIRVISVISSIWVDGRKREKTGSRDFIKKKLNPILPIGITICIA